MRKLALLLAALITVAGSLFAAAPANATNLWYVGYDNYYHNANPSQPAERDVASNRSPSWKVGSSSHYLIFQGDCNLVAYTSGLGAVWASGTNGIGGPCWMKFQPDGNWVIYNAYNQPGWATGTSAYGNSEVLYAQFQDFSDCGPDIVGVPHGVNTLRWASGPGC